MTDLKPAVRRVEAALGCNRLLYWLGRIPLVKKLFPARLYAAGPTKEFLMDAVRVLKWIYAVLGKFLYLLLIMALPAISAAGADRLADGWGAALWCFFWLSLVCGAFLQPACFEATTLKYVCVLQLRLPARDFIRYAAGRQYLKKWITFLPALTVFALAFGRPWWTGPVLTAALAAACLTAEGFHLLLWRRWKKLPSANPWFIVLLVGLSVGLASGSLFANQVPPAFVLHPAALAVLALGGVWGALSLVRFRDWYSLVKKYSKPENISVAYAKAQGSRNNFKDVQLKSQDLTVEAAGGSARTGWPYLNDVFFRRHRRLLARPTLIADVILAALCAAACAAAVLFPDLMARLLPGLLTGALPFLVFLAYFLFNTLGTRICKAMFYNCDVSLLRYSWYRSPDVVLKNFTIRLGKLLVLNLSVSLILGVGLTLASLLARLPMAVYGGDLLAFVVSLQLLAVMFAVHPLFLYYVFQPYTSDLNVKNPFFSALNWIMYAVCYGCVFLDQPPAGFAFLVMGATAIYTAAALVLVKTRAPRTFRVK